MPVTKEFPALIEYRPSMLGKVCQAFADEEVNILALECFPTRGKFETRLIIDKPDIPRRCWTTRSSHTPRKKSYKLQFNIDPARLRHLV